MAFTAATKLETTVPMAQARETALKLVAQGYASGHATQDKTRGRVELERDLVTQRADLTTLKAPVAGAAQQLAIRTAGGGVTEAQALMIIVTEGTRVTADSVNHKKRGAVFPVTLALKTQTN
jgi:hemolysin D